MIDISLGALCLIGVGAFLVGMITLFAIAVILARR
jgi:hypothetical protein